MIFGVAEVKGSSKTFITDTFEEQDLIGDDYVADIPPVHPLWAVFYTLNYPQNMNLMQNPFYLQTWLAQMGYMCNSTYGSASAITQPSLQQLSDHLSYGIAYMANAITILSVSSDEWYPAVVHVDKVSRTRSPRFIAVTFVVLGLWFMLLAVLTAKMYRPTFGDGLNSYVVSRLLADEPSVLEGHGCGAITKNKLVTTEFKRIGDGRGEEKVGHIRVGGQTLLSSSRRYA
ncbi:hypothetical protein VNI00_017864 [Paramarasmius palmivorus]|uniref:Uncharacterized protein n=1 Tax=Paramarasmius palmivorus TaxID=297713 RepID=A0AAW0B4N6_9AGAR